MMGEENVEIIIIIIFLEYFWLCDCWWNENNQCDENGSPTCHFLCS